MLNKSLINVMPEYILQNTKIPHKKHKHLQTNQKVYSTCKYRCRVNASSTHNSNTARK